MMLDSFKVNGFKGRTCNFVLAVPVVLTALAFGNPVKSATMGFTSNPTSNSSDFTTAAISQGATIDSSVNFDSLPTGPLVPFFYPGIRLISIGDVNTIVNGAGPGEPNTFNSSPGEGINTPSNFLLDRAQPSTLILSFLSGQVLGAGFTLIDYFNNPSNTNPLTIEAFTDIDGTGNSLGSFSSVRQNFQRNGTYFMGILSDSPNIGSIVFSQESDSTGDIRGIDNILIARPSDEEAIPEPFTIFGSLMAIVTGVVLKRKRRSQLSVYDYIR